MKRLRAAHAGQPLLKIHVGFPALHMLLQLHRWKRTRTCDRGILFFFLPEAESKLTVFNTLTLLTQVTPVYVLFNLQICLSAPDALRDSNSTFEV